jgi:ABC-2 type transport system permease protein
MMALPRSLVQFLAVATKEIRQTAADKRMIGMLIVAPLIQLTIFGFAVNLDVDRLKTIVVDEDQSAFSRRHVQGLLADGTLVGAGESPTAAAAERAIEDGSADVALIVPKSFARDVQRGEPTHVQAIVDGTNPNKSGTAQSSVARYFGEAADEARAQRRSELGEPPEAPLFSLRSRVLYNPSLKTAPFMLPGILAITLLINTALLTAIGLSREKETGTLEQVLVTPIHPLVLMLGKIVPSVVIGLFEFLLALAASAWIFELPLLGSFTFLMSSTCLFLLSTLGVGLLVSTFSKTQQQAFMGVFLFILPANLLSGMLTPVSSMPGWLEPLTRINPVRYYIEILRSALLEGAGLAELWMQVAALASFGAVILVVSCRRLETRLA